MNRSITGGCLCGAVTYRIEDSFSDFYFCFCEQCRRVTGSAFASNLQTSTDNFEWTSGENLVKRFDVKGRVFTKVFCTECGSGLPFLTQSGESMLVPAGSLDEVPGIETTAHIFCAETADWYKSGQGKPEFDGFKET